MLRSFHAELQKAHRRHDLLLCLLVPLIMILWVGGLAPSDPEELANGYSALLYSIPVIEAILMPVLMAVLASRLWEIEVKGSMPKFLYTLQERRSLFAPQDAGFKSDAKKTPRGTSERKGTSRNGKQRKLHQRRAVPSLLS